MAGLLMILTADPRPVVMTRRVVAGVAMAEIWRVVAANAAQARMTVASDGDAATTLPNTGGDRRSTSGIARRPTMVMVRRALSCRRALAVGVGARCAYARAPRLADHANLAMEIVVRLTPPGVRWQGPA